MMRLPTIRGIIDRRVLVNFRVDPATLSKILPAPFRPQIVAGFGIAGICLIRLKQLRPQRFPGWLGIGSENAAHRIAVQWDTDGGSRTGVYIPRRDTSSTFNVLAGGRIFPGVHHLATFDVDECEPHFRIEMHSRDRSAHVLVDGRVTTRFPVDSLFTSIDEASQFFANGSLGYSLSTQSSRFDGLELRTHNWRLEPLEMTSVASSFFDHQERFPRGTIQFDNALLMRGIEHEWHSQESLCCHR